MDEVMDYAFRFKKEADKHDVSRVFSKVYYGSYGTVNYLRLDESKLPEKYILHSLQQGEANYVLRRYPEIQQSLDRKAGRQGANPF